MKWGPEQFLEFGIGAKIQPREESKLAEAVVFMKSSMEQLEHVQGLFRSELMPDILNTSVKIQVRMLRMLRMQSSNMRLRLRFFFAVAEECGINTGFVHGVEFRRTGPDEDGTGDGDAIYEHGQVPVVSRHAVGIRTVFRDEWNASDRQIQLRIRPERYSFWNTSNFMEKFHSNFFVFQVKVRPTAAAGK